MARTSLAVLAALLGGTLTACSDDPALIGADNLTCDHDPTAIRAKSIVERVGGLVGDGFVVRLAQSTSAGVVALVEGDVERAYDVLHDGYEVSVVAAVADDDRGPSSRLAQVQDVVSETCG